MTPGSSRASSSSTIADRVRRDLEEMAASDPIWRDWLDLTERALDVSRDPRLTAGGIELDAERPDDAPLLAGAVARLDPAVAAEWLRHVLDRSASSADAGDVAAALERGEADALAVTEAAIDQDEDRLAEIAIALDVDLEWFATVAGLAARPPLLAWGEALQAQVPSGWSEGYCPVCAGWPALAEMRGLDRERWLRCARCAAEWNLPWLRCPWCGTTDHDRLGSLTPAGEAESRRIDVCNQCMSYVKTNASLRRLSPREVAFVDAGTLDLDIVAIERGYTRSSGRQPTLGLRLLPDSGVA